MNGLLTFPTEREAMRYRNRISPSVASFPPLVPRSPAAIPGCNLWARASEAAEYYADGARVNYWRDLSGYGHHLTTATASQRPLFATTNEVHPCLIWDGTCLLSNAAYPVNRRSVSALWVGEINDVDGAMYLIAMGGITIVLICQDGIFSIFGAGGNTSLRPPSGRRIAIVLTCSASGTRVYLDSVTNVASLSAGSATTATGIGLSGAGVFNGRVHEVAGFDRALSVSDVAALLEYARLTYGTGSTVVSQGRVIFDGDSVTEGTGSTRLNNWTRQLRVNPSWLMHNFAISGQRLDQMATDQSEVNTPFANSTNWLFCYGGYNDLGAGDSGATVESELDTYCTAAISAGFDINNIVVFTLSVAGTFAARDDANTAIRSNYTNYASWLVDVAADSELGCVTGANTFNDSSNYADGVHPNDKGIEKLCKLIRSTVTGLPF